ncbi:zinc finger protein 449-like [Apodemus sylvaticus]|uniref:zinc finger protein 449-like n=1 Tax=Apodemus sylvaticus TaxID=10129 RepID=UPI0022441E32|nr:zinc finger protein 449-like [Apodemus sylvaticus]
MRKGCRLKLKSAGSLFPSKGEREAEEARWDPVHASCDSQSPTSGVPVEGPRSAVSGQPACTMDAPSNSATPGPSQCHQDPRPQESGTACETSRQRFRQFQYDEADGPQEAFCKLWELCSQWLKPQTRSVEQILALLVLEQFLHILPTNTETERFTPEIKQRLFTLIGDLKRDHKTPGSENNMRDVLLEELMSVCTFLTQSNAPVSPPAFQIIEPAQEIREIPPEQPRERNVVQPHPLLNIEFHLSREYEQLEPPGKEPPEELLAEYKEPEENQMSCQQEMPASFEDAQPSSSRAPTQAPPRKKPNSDAQLGLCFAHRKQYNICQKTHTKKVAPGGARGGTGSAVSGQQLISQEEEEEEDICENAMGSDPATEVTPPSVSQADDLDDERRQCRLCKKEFMFQLGLRETVSNSADTKPYQCSFCGKFFRGQSHVTAHQVRHTKERPFICEHCQKSYKHKSSLLRHLKFHTRDLESKESEASQSLMHDESQ